MEDHQSQLLAEFSAISGVDDPASALAVLEATNWNLEEAVNLHFASGVDAAAARGSPTPAAAAAAPDPIQEEEVRAPIPAMRDRLYGDVGHGHHGVPRVARYGAAPEHVDVFANFQQGAAGAGGSHAAAGASAAAAAGGAAHGGAGLSELFKPPAGMMFPGDFEAAKAHAAQQGRWLLVNVQSPGEFASHRLNRDTWGESFVQDTLRGSFVFWQVHNSAEQGGQIIASYHLDELPASLLLDPITGAKVWEHYGFIAPDVLIEELVPFLDAGPNDPGASALAHRSLKQAAKRRNRAPAAAAAAAAAGGAAAGVDHLTEEEQLALAVAMSVEGTPGSPAAGGTAEAAAGSTDDVDEAAIWQEIQRRQQEQAAAAAAAPGAGQPAAAASPALAPQPQPGQAEAAAADAAPVVDVAGVQAAAAAQLPPEPAEGAAGSCRVAFRLPDGTRVQRRFNTTDTVAALQHYVVSVSGEAAAMAGFRLAEARPGSAALSDEAATIGQAGVAGAMLVLRSS